MGPDGHVAAPARWDAKSEFTSPPPGVSGTSLAEGCKIGRRLLPEIQRLGYTGRFSNLERPPMQLRAVGHTQLAPRRMTKA